MTSHNGDTFDGVINKHYCCNHWKNKK